MKRLILSTLIILSPTVLANSQMKLGLWEFKVTSKIDDGRDKTAEYNATRVKTAQMMAKMPPEQLKKLGANLAEFGSDGSIRLCIDSEAAARYKSVEENRAILSSASTAEQGCEPPKMSQNGDKISYEVNCVTKDSISVKKGEIVIGNDIVISHDKTTTTSSTGNHTKLAETQMKFIASDCQGIKPDRL